MDKLLICRICLIENVNMHCIVDTYLHEMYEKLTEMPFETKDSRPLHVCYICRERLHNCFKLKTSCLKSEEVFTQILENGWLTPTSLQNSQILKISQPIIHASIEPSARNYPCNDATDDNEAKLNSLTTLNVQIKEEHMEDNLNTEGTEGHFEIEIKDEFPSEANQYNTVNMWQQIQEDSIETFIPRSKESKLTIQNNSSSTFSKFETELWYQHHMKTVSANKPMRQNKCSDKPYKCTTCKKSFGQKKHLMSHTRIHSGEKQYKCEVCEKCFSRGSYLKVHRRLHTEDKPHKCEICGKSYNDKYNFVNHLRAHNNEKPYQCDVCKKCFSCKRHLISHIRTHNSERAFKCNICHKRFHAKHNLNAHIRIHTGEKPYKCSKCDKAFRQKQHLNGHFRIHTGEKPYKCEICDKCFQRKSYLIDHAHRHTGEKSHKCNICEKSFSSKRNLMRHICPTPAILNQNIVCKLELLSSGPKDT